MYPPAYALLRTAVEDTELRLSRFDRPEQIDVWTIKKGTQVIFDLVGWGHSPELFPNPEKFDPQRWTHGRSCKSPANPRPLSKDESPNFSTGPRVCLGKKFATVEAVAFLTFVLRDWRVEPVLLPGETVLQWEMRILTPTMVVTMHFRDKVPLRFVRRQAVPS